MFDWLREIRDNIKAEVYLSLPAKKERSSLWRGIINEDGALCAEFEDSYNRIIIGRILSDIENKNLSIYDPVELLAEKTGYSKKKVASVVEAEKIVLFLRKKSYGNDEIKRIGTIAMSLQKNKGDAVEVSRDTGADMESISAVISLINEYATSIGGQVVWSAPSTETEKETQTKSTSKKTSSKAAAKKEMVKPLSVPAGATS